MATGALVPTEKEIAAVLPVSLGTIQIALRRLAADGIIERTRGQGTRITTTRNPNLEPKHVRFFADDGESLLPLTIHVASVQEIEEQGPWSTFLGARPSYLRIVRHISVAGEFNIYNEFYLDAARFRPLLDIAPETYQQMHIRVILHDRFNCPTLRFVQNIQIVTPEPMVTDIIGTAPRERALALEVLSHSLRDRPLSYQGMIIPLNDRKLNVLDAL